MLNPKKIKKIEINFIPKEKQRFECYKASGCADYFMLPRGLLVINISRSEAWRPQWLVLLHEIIEIILVLHKKISFIEIDKFDISHSDSEDPGALKSAPYHKQHIIALFLESYIARKISVKPDSY